MLLVFLLIFLADAKIVNGYNFGGSLKDYFIQKNICQTKSSALFCKFWANFQNFISQNKDIYSFAKIYHVKIFETSDP